MLINVALRNYWPVRAEAFEDYNGTGRPTVITWETVEKLRFAFMVGASEREACIYAGIHRCTLYRYQEKNPYFCDQKDAWKDWVVLQARKVIADAIRRGDVKTSWRYLRTYRSKEFA